MRPGNGGDGWSSLDTSNAGCAVHVLACAIFAARCAGTPRSTRVAVRMGIAHELSVVDGPALAARLADADLVVDAARDRCHRRAARGAIAAAIEALARLDPGRPPVLALDVPSGFDADTGARAGACVRADVTATFAAEKVGFAAAGGRAWLGRVQVVDIGVPRALFARVV